MVFTVGRKIVLETDHGIVVRDYGKFTEGEEQEQEQDGNTIELPVNIKYAISPDGTLLAQADKNIVQIRQLSDNTLTA